METLRGGNDRYDALCRVAVRAQELRIMALRCGAHQSALMFEGALYEALSAIGARGEARPDIPQMPKAVSVVHAADARMRLVNDIERVSMSARDAARRGGSDMCGFLLGMATDAAREFLYELHAKYDFNHSDFTERGT